MNDRIVLDKLVRKEACGKGFAGSCLRIANKISFGLLFYISTEIYIGPGKFVRGEFPMMNDGEKQRHLEENDGLAYRISLAKNKAVADVYCAWLGFTGGNARSFSYDLKKENESWIVEKSRVTGMS